MTKETCQNCKNSFVIESDDLSFYEKMKIPPPTFCVKCRLARRLAWRNERSLYHRNCDLCKSKMISMYKPNTPFPVYCHECWWSDKWSPLDYGKDYDFSKPFFEQFKSLQNIVPKPALYSSSNTNSEYCNHTAHMKDSYLVFGSWFCENCSYGQTILESKDCWDCLFCKKCEFCYSSVDCTKCNRVNFSRECTNCIDSAFLYDCRNCQDCIFSYNLRNKNYCILNEQVSKDDYEKIKKEVFSSHTKLKESLEKFKTMVKEKALHKFMTGEQNQNVSGEFIYNSKNVHKSYYMLDGENNKYVVRGDGQRDSMDIFGVNRGELAYDSNNVDFSSYCLFSVNGENNFNTEYVADSFNVKNVFGCLSLRKQEYCILNKQYGKEEYNELVAKIKKQMVNVPFIDSLGREYRYGEFFPIENSPFCYNESLAQEYLPIPKEEALKNKYPWYDIEDKNYTPTKKWSDLPNTINDVNDSILSETILCEAWDKDKNKAQEHKCTMAFKITPDELNMYRRFNISLPRKCPNTRNYELFKSRNPVEFWHRKCMRQGCSNEFETSYSPDRPEIVYCENCYKQAIV
ncbi:MAG: hypothetical protein WC241_03820 [Candidatus Paceibacterota bacterium]|jgi:hypothetical protein